MNSLRFSKVHAFSNSTVSPFAFSRTQVGYALTLCCSASLVSSSALTEFNSTLTSPTILLFDLRFSSNFATSGLPSAVSAPSTEEVDNY